MAAEPAVLPGELSGLEGLLDVLPSPLLLVERGSGRMLFANRAAHALAGGSMRLAAGTEDYDAHYACFDEHGRPVAGAAMPAARASRGERFANVRLDWDTAGARRALVVSGAPIAVPALADRVAVVTFEDVSSVVAERRRASLLAGASAQLARSLDYAETLAAVARVTVPAVADWCFVELLTPDGRIERALMESADPARRRFAAEYDARFPLDPDAPVGSAQVIRTGEPELVEQLGDAVLRAVAQDPAQLALLRQVGFGSTCIVPLRVRGVVIGCLALATAESGRRFGPDDLPLVEQLADRCAVALDNARLHTEARRSRDELEAILEGVPDAVTAQDPGGQVVYANRAAVRLFGYASAEALTSASPADVAARYEVRAEDGGPVDFSVLPGRRALMGERPEPLVLRVRNRADGEERWTRVQATPVLGDDGTPRLAINVVEDVTELKRAGEGQARLAEASRMLAGSLDYEETLRSVARLAVPEMADWCAVDLAGRHGPERVAVAHVDPSRVALARELHDRYPPDPDAEGGVAGVLRSGRSELWPEIDDAMLAAVARDPEHLALIRSIGMRSAMIVPMRARERTLGVLSFVSAESGRRFDAHDLQVAEDLGLRAATAVENARLYAARSAIAQTLQASLLPPELPRLPGMELAAAYRAAGDDFEVGGDFYDVFSTGGDHWYAVVGDVCGKGAEAAAVTALARYTVRAAAVHRRSPSAILRWLSDAMVRQHAGSGRFATIACVHLDLGRSPVRVTVACGGHPLPVLVRAGGVAEEVGAPGTLLGLVDDPVLQDRSADLRPGDALLLYTDGLTEAGAPERVWSPDDLLRAGAATAGRSAADAVDQLLAAALGARPAVRDDVALLALRAAG